MIHTYSDNAIMAKARALYGKRLTEQDYNLLLQKKTVAEIAAFLKKETYYAENLREVREDLIHRGQLEFLLRRCELGAYQRLRQYAQAEPLFLKIYVMQNEIEQLLLAIRLFNADAMDRYIVELPGYLSKMMSFDLYALANVRSFDSLLTVVEHSPYFRDIAAHRPMGARRLIDITACEAALLTRYYDTILNEIRKNYRGQTRQYLEQLILHRLELHNISLIYRMRRYHRAPRNMIEERIVRVTGVNYRFYNELLSAPDIETVQRLIGNIRRMRHMQMDWEKGPQYLSGLVRRGYKELSQHIFRFSTSPVVVVLSYMALLETEITNLIFIIEGVRYGVAPAQTRELLSI